MYNWVFVLLGLVVLSFVGKRFLMFTALVAKHLMDRDAGYPDE